MPIRQPRAMPASPLSPVLLPGRRGTPASVRRHPLLTRSYPLNCYSASSHPAGLHTAPDTWSGPARGLSASGQYDRSYCERPGRDPPRNRNGRPCTRQSRWSGTPAPGCFRRPTRRRDARRGDISERACPVKGPFLLSAPFPVAPRWRRGRSPDISSAWPPVPGGGHGGIRRRRLIHKRGLLSGQSPDRARRLCRKLRTVV